MTITLPPEQQKWLEAQVEAGHYASIEEAVRIAVDDLMADFRDLAWARPYVDQARASVARGDTVAGDEFLRRLDAKLAALRTTT
jgi:antitoxin ParD1/3/4